jgi:hypothetical protein
MNKRIPWIVLAVIVSVIVRQLFIQINKSNNRNSEVLIPPLIKKENGDVFTRMVNPKNTHVDEEGNIVALVGQKGELYDMATIKKVMSKVADGSLSGKQLDDFLGLMPYFLKNGDAFATSFTKQMKILEKAVQKETFSKSEQETIEKVKNFVKEYGKTENL